MPVGDILRSAAYLARQAGAGAVETFGLGSKRPGDPRNATQIPLVEPLAGGVYTLGKLASEALPLSHRLYIPAMEESVEKQRLNSEAINEKFGVTEPKNALELAARISSAFIGPGAPAKAAVKATGVLPAVGRVVREVALPLRQGGPKTIAAATGLVTGISEAVDAVSDDPEYHSVADLVKPERAQLQPEKATKDFTEYLDPEVIEDYNQAQETGDIATINEIEESVVQLQEADYVESLKPPKPDWETEKNQLAALAMAAVGVGVGARTVRGVKSRLINPSTLAGQTTEPIMSNVGTQAGQSVVQNDQAWRDANKVFTDPTKPKIGQSKEQRKFEAQLDTITSAPMQARMKHFVTTGQIRGANTKTTPVADILVKTSRDLTPQEKGLLIDGMLADSVLDDIKATGNHTTFVKDRNGVPKSISELTQIRDAVLASPKLAGYALEVKKSYRDQLDFLLEKNIIDQDTHTKWLARRPNYVPINKDEVSDPINALLGKGPTGAVNRNPDVFFQRSLDEGVQVGEAADPIMELGNQWARVIKAAAINDVKAPWLEKASSHAKLKEFVVRSNKPFDDDANVHVVFENGKKVYYKIKDQSLANALDASPFVAKHIAQTMLGIPKRTFEFGTTGAGAPAFAPVANTYDAVGSVMMRPKGYQLGLLNEFANTITKGQFGKSKVGELTAGMDPTAWIAGPVGALRMGADGIVQSVARELALQLSLGKGAVYDSIGPQATQALETRLAAMYKASVKNKGDELGVFNSSPFVEHDLSQMAPGMADYAPRYGMQAAWTAMRNALDGDTKPVQKIIETAQAAGKLGSISTRSALKFYTYALKSMHEGVRYQGLATNLPKVVGDAELEDMLASETRRLAGDMGQTGGGQWYDFAKDTSTYLNPSVQGLAQFGRQLKNQPLTTATNVISAMTGIAVLFLAGAALDPEQRAKIREMSDEQLARAFPTIAGLPMNIPPDFRPLIAPMIGTLMEISGMRSVNPDGTDNFDPNIGRMALQMMDGDEWSEEGRFGLETMMSEAVAGAIPWTPNSMPVFNATGAAFYNMDVGFTRYAAQGGGDAEPQAIKKQEQDLLGGDGRYIGDAISAQNMKVLESVIGAHFTGHARAALDAQRALDGGGTAEEAWDQFTGRLVDNEAKRTGPTSVFFDNYIKRDSANTTRFRLFYEKKQGFDEAIKIFNEQIATPMTNSKDPASAMLSQLDPMDIERNQALIGTQLMPIGSIAAQINSTIRSAGIDRRMSQLREQILDIDNQRFSSPEAKNEAINELNEEREDLVATLNDLYEVGEDNIRDFIGDPKFTWQEFAKDPKRYERPLVPTQPPVVPE